jgi:hypothetical protein
MRDAAARDGARTQSQTRIKPIDTRQPITVAPPAADDGPKSSKIWDWIKAAF